MKFCYHKIGQIIGSILILCGACLQPVSGQGKLRVLENLSFEKAVYYPGNQSLYATVYSGSFPTVSRSLFKLNPTLGRIEKRIDLGAEPRFLQATSDQSTLFFVNPGQPYLIKRFSLATESIDQADTIAIITGDEVQSLATIPNNNQRVLMMVRRAGSSSYLAVYERGQSQQRYIKFGENEVSGMTMAVTQDSIVWVVSPITGTITKLKIRADGLHYDKIFSGYHRSLEFGYTQVETCLISTDGGQYLQLNGDAPRVLGRLELGRYPKVTNLPGSAFFYSIESASGYNHRIRKFRKLDFQEVETIDVHAFDRAGAALNFYACTEDLFVFSNYSRFTSSEQSTNMYKHCTSKLPKPVIASPAFVNLCALTDTGFVFKVDQIGLQYNWKKDDKLPKTLDVYKIIESGIYKVQVSDEKGCLGEFSDPVSVYFDYPPDKPLISYPTEHGYPVNICIGQEIQLTAFGNGNPQWSKGEKTKAITVNNSGKFNVRLQSYGGCWSPWSDTLVVIQTKDSLPTKPKIKLLNGSAVIFCAGDTARFETKPGYSKYSWNYGFSNSQSNQFKLTLFSSFSDYRVQVRYGNQPYCMSANSDEFIVRTISVPIKPQITRSSNVLMSNIIDPLATHDWYFNGKLIDGANGRFLNANKEGFYSTRIRYGNCASPVSDVLPFTGILTSTDEAPQANTPKLFPNPATDELFLKFSSLPKERQWQLRLTDTQGRQHEAPSLNWSDEGVSLKVAHLVAGTYVLQGKSSEGVWALKFVKQ